MDTQEKRELVDNVINSMKAGGYEAAELIPAPLSSNDPLIEMIANRFWRCNELSAQDSMAYAEIAVNVVRRNAHLISLGS